MRIYLAPLGTEKRIPADIEPDDEIDEVKRKAKASDPKLKFLFNGKLIEGGPVSDYGVEEGSVLSQAPTIFLQAETREEFPVDLEWKVGHLKKLARQRLGLGEDADIQLFTGKGQLTGDSASLREAGVKHSQTLKLLSMALAEEHARRCKVYQTDLRGALRDGVVRPSTAGDLKPFPLDSPLQDLAELGPGWPLCFELGYFLAILCAALVVLHLPVIVIYAMGSGISNWQSKSPAEPWLLLSAGNLGPDGSDSRLLGWTSHLCCLFLLLAGTYYGRRQEMLKRLYDDLEVEPMDYALLLYGMPGQALEFWRDEERIRQFVEACLGPEKKVEVVQVVLGYDVPKLQALIQDYHTLAQHGDDGADGSTPLLSSAYTKEEIQKVLTTPDLLRQELTCHACSVVVLRSPEDHIKVLSTWSTGWEKGLWLLRGLASIAKSWGLVEEEMYFGSYSHLPKIDGRHPVCIKRARAPTDYQWENLGASFADCFAARVKTHLAMGVIFLAGFLAILLAEVIAGGREGGKWWQVLLRVLTLVLVNVSAATFAKRFSSEEKHLTRTDQDDSLMVKLGVYMAFNYTFLLIAFYQHPGDSWYHVGGLLGTICVLMPTDTVLISVMAYYSVSSKMAASVKSVMSPEDPLSLPDMTQARLNRLAEPSEMSISRPLAHLVKSFLMGMFFLPFWPLGSLWMVLSLVLKTYGYKKQLLTDSKRPYRQSHVIAFSAMNFVYIGGFIYSFSAWWFMTPSLGDTGKAAVATFTPLLMVLSLYFLVAPRKLNNRFAGLFAPAVDPVVDYLLTLVGVPTGAGDGLTANSHDYYAVQHHWDRSQKYHTAHTVYQQLERAMTAQKVAPPWDPSTGSLKEPGTA